jgi:DNA invertase Pin-like site-specific DNA recombinase
MPSSAFFPFRERIPKCRQIYEELASGKSSARPQLEACLKALREGDTLVIWRLDRLGRSLADLIRLTNVTLTPGALSSSR